MHTTMEQPARTRLALDDQPARSARITKPPRPTLLLRDAVASVAVVSWTCACGQRNQCSANRPRQLRCGSCRVNGPAVIPAGIAVDELEVECDTCHARRPADEIACRVCLKGGGA